MDLMRSIALVMERRGHRCSPVTQMRKALVSVREVLMRLFAILLAGGHLLRPDQRDCSPWRMRDLETTSFEHN
jgi:hypothetical protein